MTPDDHNMGHQGRAGTRCAEWRGGGGLCCRKHRTPVPGEGVKGTPPRLSLPGGPCKHTKCWAVPGEGPVFDLTHAQSGHSASCALAPTHLKGRHLRVKVTVLRYNSVPWVSSQKPEG